MALRDPAMAFDWQIRLICLCLTFLLQVPTVQSSAAEAQESTVMGWIIGVESDNFDETSRRYLAKVGANGAFKLTCMDTKLDILLSTRNHYRINDVFNVKVRVDRGYIREFEAIVVKNSVLLLRDPGRNSIREIASEMTTGSEIHFRIRNSNRYVDLDFSIDRFIDVSENLRSDCYF